MVSNAKYSARIIHRHAPPTRIVVRAGAQRARRSWRMLTGLLLGGCAMLIGMEQLSKHAVAVELPSPKRQVRQLAQVENERAQHETAKAPPRAATKFRVSGVARMADGSALPPKTDGFALVISRNGMKTDDLPLDADGRFNREFSAQVVYLGIRSPNLATTYAGPYSDDADDLDLLLDQGFSTRVRFVDEAGEGVPGVVLEAIAYIFHGENGYMGHPHPRQGHTLESDGDGYLTIDDCSHWPVTIDARAGGYRFERQERPLQPDAVIVWKLTRAQPTTGTVLDDASGKPIAGAEFL